MWQSWFQIHKETAFDHTAQTVTTISRTPDHIDLFMIGFDNAVWSTWWEQTPSWQPWFQIHPETNFDHTTQKIVALSRPDHIDLFVIGFDGAIWSTWWEQRPGWQQWFQIHPETIFDYTTQHVVALSRTPGHIDLFVIGFDDVIWSTWWEEAPGWQPWFQIHPETKFDHKTQRIAALSRTPDHIDLFVIGFDNVIWSAWWEQAPSWQPWFQIHGETKFDHTTQQIAALSRSPDHIDLFVIGFDNAVWSAWWEQAPSWQPWFQIHPEVTFDHTAQAIVALSRTPDHIDLFAIGYDNAVWSTYWEQAPSWQPWFQVHPELAFDHTSQRVAALSRTPDQVDLFVTGNDNAVWSTWWQPDIGIGHISSDGSTETFDSGPLTSDLALGGSLRVVMDKQGSFTFSCHAHDSGFDNIDYVAAAVVLDPNGIAFTFAHTGHVEGTIAGLPFGKPSRDDTFTTGGPNQQITAEWDSIVNGSRMSAQLTGKDKLVGGVEGMLGDLLDKALQEAGEAAAKAVVALVIA